MYWSLNMRLLAAMGLLLPAALGCGDDAESPTQPGSEPSAAVPQFAVASNTWITRADLPSTERYGLATAVIQNASGESILYAIGGKTVPRLETGSLSKVQAYNVATNTWTYKASLPSALFQTNGTGVIGGKIYISGGLFAYKGYSNRLFMYDPATNKWTEKREMPNTGYSGVTGVINGKLYVLTGCDQEDCFFTQLPMQFYRYDPVTDNWATLPIPLRPPLASHQGGVGGVIGGKFYVASRGGTDAYDPATNTWTAKAPMPELCGPATGTAIAAKLYVVGGNRLNPDGSVTNCKPRVYDPATDSWSLKAAPPTIRVEASASRVLVNGQPRLELVGGTRPGNNLQYVP